jgi:alpha-amylase
MRLGRPCLRRLARATLLAAPLAPFLACSAAAPPPRPQAAAARQAVGESVQWDLEWARGAVFYEVFVRSFADSDGDGVGDLAGLTARLDHLNDGDPTGGNDLGVDALWLMPVFESPSYHGYDVVDYDSIDGEYGSEEDFDRFLAEAHRRGMRVILDLVVNHTGRDHPWFVEAAASPASPRRDWYVWRQDDPGWTQPWGGDHRTWHPADGAFYYGIFWGGMPDLDWRHPPVREEMAAIALRWLDRGVDGFRLDATRHLVANGPGALQNDQPETHAALREFAAAVRARHPDALLVGENWTDTETIATYYGSTAEIALGDELPMSFDFPLAEAILQAVAAGDARPVADQLAAIAAAYPPGVLDATFLTNHDQTRLATRLDGDPGALRLAAALLLTLPGTPFLYYGEEVGLANGPGAADPAKRTPMPWEDDSPGGGFTTGEPWHPFAPGRDTANVADQQADPASLFAWYRELIALRRASPAIRRGDLEVLATGGEPGLLVFRRRAGGEAGREETVLVAHNLGAAAAALPPTVAALLAGAQPLLAPATDGLGSGGGGLDAGNAAALPARSTRAWRLSATPD